MRKKVKYIGLTLLFVIGLSILLYPAISNLWNRHRAEKLMTKYNAAVSDNEEEESRYLKEAQAYNRSLLNNTVYDAFSVGEDVENKKYESLLNVNNDGVMGSVEIPAIDVNLPIYHYTTEESLEKGAGHLLGSSLPVGGESTHAVITAHRGLPSAKLFTDLNLLKEGDVFYIHVLNETLAYQVDQILTVEPSDTTALAIEEGKDYVTLLTCTPYAVNSHRLLVRGFRISYEEETYKEVSESSPKRTGPLTWITLLCAAAGAGLAVGVVSLISRKKTAGSDFDDEEKESGEQREPGTAKTPDEEKKP